MATNELRRTTPVTVGIKDGVHLGRRVLGEGRRRTRLTRSQNIEKMTDYREGRHASGETCETAGTHGRRRWCRDYARAIGALEGYLRAERDTGTFLDAAVLTRPLSTYQYTFDEPPHRRPRHERHLNRV